LTVFRSIAAKPVCSAAVSGHSPHLHRSKLF
jgi:hypothetical protein